MSKTYDRRINIYINGKEVENNVKSIRNEMFKLVNEQARMTIGSDEYVKKTKEIRQLKKIIDEHNQSLRTSGGTWDKLKGLLPIASVGAISAKVIQLSKELYNLSKKMEADYRRSSIVFGDSLSYVEAEASKLSRQIGVTDKEFVAMAANTADLLIPLDFSRKRAAEMSVELQKLTGALDEWTGGSIGATEISNILTKAMLGENEQLKQLGISIRKDSEEYIQLVKSKRETTGATKAQAEAMATLELIQKKSLDAQTAYNTEGNKLLRLEKDIQRFIKQKKEDLVDFLNGPRKTELEKMEDVRRAFNKEIEVLTTANFSQEERSRKIAEINQRYGPYMTNLLDEKATLDDIRRVQDEVNQNMLKKILYIKYEEEIQGLIEEQLKAAEAVYNLKQKEVELQNQLYSSDYMGGMQAQTNLNKALQTINQQTIDGTEEATKKVKEKYDALAASLGTTMEQILNLFNVDTPDFKTGPWSMDDKTKENIEKMRLWGEQLLQDHEWWLKSYEEKQADFLAKEVERIVAAGQKASEETMKLLESEEKERLDFLQGQLNDRYNFYQQYASAIGAVLGQAVADGEMTAKEAAKQILIIALDALKQYARVAIAQATIGSLVTPDSILTFGASAIGRMAILTGLIEAAVGAAQGAIKNLYTGGPTGSGEKYEVKGLVHANEYVANSEMVSSPVTGPIIQMLEDYRTMRLPGYAGGGMTGGMVGSNEQPGLQTQDPMLVRYLQENYEFLKKLNHDGVKTNFTYKDVQYLREGLNRISQIEDDVSG